jgi:hypothetical protein
MNMKKMILAALFLLSAIPAFAGDVYVNGYTRSNGTYVQGYHRTTPDNTVNNNYGTVGNQNPYTGAYGTRPTNQAQPQGQYNSGNGAGYNYGVIRNTYGQGNQ